MWYICHVVFISGKVGFGKQGIWVLGSDRQTGFRV